MSKAEDFAALEVAYVEFRDLFATLPPEAYAETVAGEWSAAQLLAHLAGGYRDAVTTVRRIAEGQDPYEGSTVDTDALNARYAAAALDGPAALDDFDMAFHAFYAALKGLGEEHFGADEAGIPKPASFLANTGHFAEHRPAIEAWLSRR